MLAEDTSIANDDSRGIDANGLIGRHINHVNVRDCPRLCREFVFPCAVRDAEFADGLYRCASFFGAAGAGAAFAATFDSNASCSAAGMS